MPDSKPPITFCIDHLRADGAQKWLVHLAVGLKNRGFDVAVIGLNDNPSPQVTKALMGAGIPVQIAGKISLATGFGLIKLARTLYRRRNGSVISALFFSDLLTALLARVIGIRYLVRAVRARNLHYSPLQWSLEKYLTAKRDAHVFISESALRFEEQKIGAKAPYSCVIRNWIGTSNSITVAPPSIQALRSQWNIAPEQVALGVLGRLETQKNSELIIHALSRVRSTEIVVLLAGQGSLLNSLRDLANRLGVSERVRFLGYLDEPLKFLSAIDLMVTASRFEGQPHALLEAISVRCPVLLSDIPEHRETVRLLTHTPDASLLFFDDNSQASLVAKLDGLARTLPKLREIVTLMHAEAVGHSLDAMVSAWVGLLERQFASSGAEKVKVAASVAQ